jgi:hypothetical protein
MTEEDWLHTPRVSEMVRVQRLWDSTRVNERTLRLLVAASLRRILVVFSDDDCHRACLALENYADGKTAYDELERLADHAKATAEILLGTDKAITAASLVAEAVDSGLHSDRPSEHFDNPLRNARSNYVMTLMPAAMAVAFVKHGIADDHGFQTTMQNEMGLQADLLRDVVGNPYQPLPALDPAWRSSTIMRAAHRLYDDRLFDRLPEIADALEDCGCTSAAILDHLRQSRAHTRGCWALDLVRVQT